LIHIPLLCDWDHSIVTQIFAELTLFFSISNCTLIFMEKVNLNWNKDAYDIKMYPSNLCILPSFFSSQKYFGFLTTFDINFFLLAVQSNDGDKFDESIQTNLWTYNMEFDISNVSDTALLCELHDFSAWSFILIFTFCNLCFVVSVLTLCL